MKQYDAIIIGFGKGGKLLAAELAERNWKVAIVERSPQMYNPQIEMFARFKMKSSFHKTKRII